MAKTSFFTWKRAINLVSVHVLTNLQNSEDKLIRLDISWSSKCLNQLPFLTIFFKFRLIFGISVGIIINTPAWIVFLERGFSRVILTRSKNGEFKELLISRDLMEIELNRVHFRRLCFFQLFWAEIWFFYLICFLKFRLIFGIFVGIIINNPAWIVFLERGFTSVILTTSKNGEFKDLVISRDLMEIELNGVHFRRLCFFELFDTEIRILYRIFFFSNSAIFLGFLLVSS